jgi:branched-chain amino acid transport system substrate-binding protein
MHRCLLLGLAVLAGGCGGSAAPAPIYVGHVAALSGPDKTSGEQAFRAIRLAVKEQNKTAAESHGRPIIVRHTDTKGNLDAFEAQAVRLVTVSRVAALLGGGSADEVARLDKAQAPLVTSGQRTRGLSELVFFTGLSPAFQGQVLARFAVENLHAAKVVVLVDEGREDALALAEAFTRGLRQAAAKKDPKSSADAATWRYGKEPPVADWAKRLAQEKPQALLLAGEARALTKWRQGLHFAGPILHGGADARERQLLDSGEADGVYLATPFVRDLDVPRAKEFMANYRQEFSEDPEVDAALAYDSARVLFEAIGQAQAGLNMDGIIKEVPKQLLKLKDFPGLTGPLSFTPERQLLRPAFVVQVEKGGVKTIRRFPADG